VTPNAPCKFQAKSLKDLGGPQFGRGRVREKICAVSSVTKEMLVHGRGVGRALGTSDFIGNSGGGGGGARRS